MRFELRNPNVAKHWQNAQAQRYVCCRDSSTEYIAGKGRHSRLMFKRTIGLFVLVLLCVLAAGSAFGYEFWGVTIGTASYNGSTHLTFDGLKDSELQYVVGGYKYTRVDSTWYGPFTAAAPGEGFLASRKSDAQGLFFKADSDAARFVIVAGTPQTGYAAPECGTGSRIFGPGDLKIDVGGNTFGVGLRLGGLLWAVDPYTTNPEHKIYTAGGGIDSIFARDAGTLGSIELNPRWARVGHSRLNSNSDQAYAFFVSGSGVAVGSASVSVANTGINLYGAGVYVYEVGVPWSVLGLSPNNYAFRVSWRPDCGNDILSADFAGSSGLTAVPEPSSAAALIGGLAVLLGSRKRQ